LNCWCSLVFLWVDFFFLEGVGPWTTSSFVVLLNELALVHSKVLCQERLKINHLTDFKQIKMLSVSLWVPKLQKSSLHFAVLFHLSQVLEQA
jgi:hypothetical protein